MVRHGNATEVPMTTLSLNRRRFSRTSSTNLKVESNLSIDASVILEIKIGASGLAVALIYVRNVVGKLNCRFYQGGMRTAIREVFPLDHHTSVNIVYKTGSQVSKPEA